MKESLIKYVTAGGLGLLGVLVETIPLAGVLFVAVILDCISAWDLGRRVARDMPDKATGKFKSEYGLRIFNSYFKMYSLIFLLLLVEEYILYMHEWHLAAYVTAIFCVLTAWSILENISSHNGERWAKTLQKIMVDKTERHFDIKLDCEEKKEE